MWNDLKEFFNTESEGYGGLITAMFVVGFMSIILILMFLFFFKFMITIIFIIAVVLGVGFLVLGGIGKIFKDK